MPRRLRHGADGIRGRPLRGPVDARGLDRARARRQGRPRGAARARAGRRGLQASVGDARLMAAELRILTAGFGEKDLRSINGYIENGGGYSALRKALEGAGMEAEDVLHEIDVSGLRGRGGAGFAMGKKGQFIPKGAQTNFLACNADESEPGTFKDRALIQYCPHRLVEGCILGAYAVGASFAFIYIRGEYVLQAEILEQAVREAYERGFVGENILGARYSLE